LDAERASEGQLGKGYYRGPRKEAEVRRGKAEAWFLPLLLLASEYLATLPRPWQSDDDE